MLYPAELRARERDVTASMGVRKTRPKDPRVSTSERSGCCAGGRPSPPCVASSKTVSHRRDGSDHGSLTPGRMLHIIQHRDMAMNVRLNITMNRDLYRRLKKELPRKGISSFIADAVRARLSPDK